MTANSTDTEQIWQAVSTERATLADQLRPLGESDWNHPSLCADWQVRDVVAHLILSAAPTLGWILLNVTRARGNLGRAIRDTAIRHARTHTGTQLTTELRATTAIRGTAAGTTPADRLMDLLVHGQDITIPLGIPREVPPPAAQVALARIWYTNSLFRARQTFTGYRLVATDGPWSAGAGPVIEAPAAGLLLLLTGRHAAAMPMITGDGATEWISRSTTHS